MTWAQARWDEPIIFDLGSLGRKGSTLPKMTKKAREGLEKLRDSLPDSILRKSPPNLPEISELEVVRHFTRLSQMNYSIDTGFYPLGSCTMKYNPKICDLLTSLEVVEKIHPNQDPSTIQGALEVMYSLQSWLAEIAGVSKVSLQPAAGSQGEFAGMMIIRAYHELNEDLHSRKEVIIPDSAHGTNPASAAMCGFDVVVVPSTSEGVLDPEALVGAVSEKTAGLMLTNPNTLGIFEKDILDIEKIIHDVGGLLYYDGANLNGILGYTRPGDMGFDVVHFNLHKTFGTPHGGGGPGAGPVGVCEKLEKFLPIPTIEEINGQYYLNFNLPHSIGKVRSFYGNFAVLVRAYAYIYMMGAEGLKKAMENAVINANYLARKISKIRGFDLTYGLEKPRKHEFVISIKPMKNDTGISALDVSKRLLDLGFHAPTIYFPLNVPEALMIEPTETESKETLDKFTAAMQQISYEAYCEPEKVLQAPSHTSVGRVDDVKAARQPILSFRTLRRKEEGRKESKSSDEH